MLCCSLRAVLLHKVCNYCLAVLCCDDFTPSDCDCWLNSDIYAVFSWSRYFRNLCAFCVIFLASKRRSHKSFDKYHVWEQGSCEDANVSNFCNAGAFPIKWMMPSLEMSDGDLLWKGNFYNAMIEQSTRPQSIWRLGKSIWIMWAEPTFLPKVLKVLGIMVIWCPLSSVL